MLMNNEFPGKGRQKVFSFPNAEDLSYMSNDESIFDEEYVYENMESAVEDFANKF